MPYQMTKPYRMTRQRKLILDIIRNTDIHPTAEWVFEQARQTMPSISLGTVYRNLNGLRDSGEIIELKYGSTYNRYDGINEDHYHFYCNKCNKLINIDIPIHKGLEKMVQDTIGYKVSHHRMEFYGLCNDCC